MIKRYVSAIALSLALVSGSSAIIASAVEYPNETTTVTATESEKKDAEKRKMKADIISISLEKNVLLKILRCYLKLKT
ncbi:MAG: hypothetical protein ACLR3R_16730 [Clostridium paraputrificum]